MNAHSMTFDGSLLRRGFWLYVCRIRKGSEYPIHYVGRTGDSPSHHAASPFQHIGRHLNLRVDGKENGLARLLREKDLDPQECSFELVAVGPIFEEQLSMDEHVPLRDKVDALEGALANHLEGRNYAIIGNHRSAVPCDPKLLEEVLRLVDQRLPAIASVA